MKQGFPAPADVVDELKEAQIQRRHLLLMHEVQSSGCDRNAKVTGLLDAQWVMSTIASIAMPTPTI